LVPRKRCCRVRRRRRPRPVCRGQGEQGQRCGAEEGLRADFGRVTGSGNVTCHGEWRLLDLHVLYLTRFGTSRRRRAQRRLSRLTLPGWHAYPGIPTSSAQADTNRSSRGQRTPTLENSLVTTLPEHDARAGSRRRADPHRRARAWSGPRRNAYRANRRRPRHPARVRRPPRARRGARRARISRPRAAIPGAAGREGLLRAREGSEESLCEGVGL
jgi:hypothetical protein